MHDLKHFAALTFCILMLSMPVKADDTFVSLSHENDNLGGDSDRYYTSGSRMTIFDSSINVPPVIDKIADKIPTFDLNDTTSTFYTLGQNIYTPGNIQIATQPQDDRPWAGFLYGSVGLATATHNKSVPSHVDELEFTLGIVGPESLGEETQKFVHKHISNSPEPMGWDNQLDFEPVFAISWQRRMPHAFSYDMRHANFRIEPNFSVSLGTLRSFAGAGAMAILGSSGGMDTPSRVRPAPPGTGLFTTSPYKIDWQVFAGFDARLVGQDIFLDGNTFRDSHSVDKEYLVGDASAGVSFSYSDYRLSYTLNARSKEFKTQDKESIFGSVTLTKRF